MDLKAILKARNLSDEQADKLIGDPAYASILEAFVKEAEDGKTAYQNAQQIETNLKTWNETQVVPYVRAADEKVAKTNAELAALRTHMKSLKESGYDIPDAYLETSTVTPPAPKNDSGFDPKDFDKKIYDGALTNMALVSLSNRHRKLTGGEELDLEVEYSDFEKNKRPQENLRSYIARKYDHDGLQQKVSAAAKQKELDTYADEKLAKAKADWVAANGTNPETRNPRSSRWDAVKQDDNRKQLWQTAQGRAQATQDRLKKYTDLVQ